MQWIRRAAALARANAGNNNAANWLISDWPDAYLFGALTELFGLGRNADAAILYKQRHRIENLFARLKDWRRIHTSYDRCAHTFLSAIAFAAAFIFWITES